MSVTSIESRRAQREKDIAEIERLQEANQRYSAIIDGNNERIRELVNRNNMNKPGGAA
ncbi:hypothetical protein [Jejubacter calystegiae]|uniref:hypothetical protein n=1 Tax=Jejubacter calystegiae TaxID=2579935 RepID=UPI00143D4E49|nr:hypothetical protein [Jejubacter calystegiae]